MTDSLEPLAEISRDDRILRELETQTRILFQLQPLADLLTTPLDQAGEGMVIRLHALMTQVLEVLATVQRERSEVAELRQSLEGQHQALLEALAEQAQRSAVMQDQIAEMLGMMNLNLE